MKLETELLHVSVELSALISLPTAVVELQRIPQSSAGPGLLSTCSLEAIWAGVLGG